MLGSTPSQTVGPFFAFGLPYEGGEHLVPQTDRAGIWVTGSVYDGAGDPVDDALIEIWQANRSGRYRHPEDTREELPLEDGFDGFGRCGTDAQGRFGFFTVKPGGTAPWLASRSGGMPLNSTSPRQSTSGVDMPGTDRTP